MSDTSKNAEAASASSPSSLPTILTLARMGAGLLVAALVLWAAHMAFIEPARAGRLYAWATGFFALAALTDWLDGWLARKSNSVTRLGAALDQCADKVLVTCVLVALAYAALPVDLVIASVLLLGRDMAIAGLREGLAGARNLPVGQIGKVKTMLALIAIGALLAQQSAALLNASQGFVNALSLLGAALLWGATVLALISGALYVGKAVAPGANEDGAVD